MKTIYICIIFAMMLSNLLACKNKPSYSYIDKLRDEIEHEENVPIDKSEFDKQLKKRINDALFFTHPDRHYFSKYIGTTVDYIVFGTTTIADNDPANDIYYMHIVFSSQLNQELKSASAIMGADKYGKWGLSVSNGSSETNFNFSAPENTPSADVFIKNLMTSKLKIWFSGTIDVHEPSTPLEVAFDSKADIIDEIWDWLDRYINEGDFDFSYMTAYIEDFSNDDSETHILLIPETGVENGAKVTYYLNKASQDLHEVVFYKDTPLSDEVIKANTFYYADRVMKYSIAQKDYSSQTELITEKR